MMMEKSISTETAQGIFTEHIPSLLGVHEILLKNLKLLREKGLAKSGMAKVFEKLANTFQNYGYYFVNHAGALKLLTRKKENRSFANFVKVNSFLPSFPFFPTGEECHLIVFSLLTELRSKSPVQESESAKLLDQAHSASDEIPALAEGLASALIFFFFFSFSLPLVDCATFVLELPGTP